MEILYKNKTAREQFSPDCQKKWKYPQQVKIKLLSIENAIRQATCLQDIAKLPQYHFHCLKGDLKHEWSIYVGNTGYRVTLIPCDDAGKEIVSGDILAQCKAIKIVLVTGVSNHYE